MKATFLKTKDIGFDKKDGSGHLPGKALTAMDGTEYKLWGNSSKNVSVGTEYEFEAEGGKIDGKTFRPAGQAPSAPERDYEPPINQQKQTSIETQNAVTNVSNLWAAGKLADDSLLVQNLIPYLESKLIIGSHKAQITSSPLVEAAVALGGVVKGEFPNPGAFLNKCWNEHGLQRADVEAIVGPISAEIDLDGAYLCLTTELAERSKRKSA